MENFKVGIGVAIRGFYAETRVTRFQTLLLLPNRVEHVTVWVLGVKMGVKTAKNRVE